MRFPWHEPINAGQFIDEETGEIVEIFDRPEIEAAKKELQQTDLVHWILRKMQRLNAEIRMEQTIKDEIIANCDHEINAKLKKLADLHTHYDEMISDYVWKNLPRTKDGKITKKSITTPYGQIAFRTENEKVKITDQTLAIEFVRSNFPDALITKTQESVSITALRSLGDEAYFEIQNSGEASGFTIIPKQETMSITFGKGNLDVASPNS